MADTIKANNRGMKGTKVLNRSAAPIQITAEQIVLEARDRSAAAQPPPPKQHITDPEELAAQRLAMRKEFEDRIRIQHASLSTWLRYAKWEESQNEIERARSVYERTLEFCFKVPTVWQRYAEMEMRAKFVNRARNVWDRAVTLLPRVESLWYKYTFMEEILGNVNGARTIFERWMQWEPEDLAWLSYVRLEERAANKERARAVYERYVACHPGSQSYLRLARWEEKNGQVALARRVYERAMEELYDQERGAAIYSAFAKFEVRSGEMARAQAIFKFALERLPKADAEKLYSEYVAFEKQHGERAEVEDVILTKRRAQYEGQVAANPRNYDAWFDYVRLEEGEVGGLAAGAAARAPALVRAREVYERAIANLPPIAEKRFWRRYVYLWIYYALFEELLAGDPERTRGVYKAALGVVPHASFTFAKLWLMAAQFEVRQKNVPAMRRLLGTAIGLRPKEKVLRGYIDLELRLGEVDRCRKLYERLLSLWPHAVSNWARYAELERDMREDERAHAIYDLAVAQPALDLPEVAWKAYIDFEIEAGNVAAARQLYSLLLTRTQHVKVWLSLATFEGNVAADAAAARDTYSRAYAHFKGLGGEGAEARALVVETWRAFESALLEDERAHGGDGSVHAPLLQAVEARAPKKVVRRRELRAGGDPAGSVTGWEEYYDFIFPDDETKPASLKLLELAQRWKSAGGSIGAAALLRGAGAAGGEGEGAGGAGDGECGEGDAGGGGGGGEELDEGYGAGGAPEHAQWREQGPYEEADADASGRGGGLAGAAAAAAADPNALDLDDDEAPPASSAAAAHSSAGGGLGAGGGEALRGGGSDDGDYEEEYSRASGRPSKRQRSEAPPAEEGQQQPVGAERGDGEDSGFAREEEREQEDLVRSAPSSSAAPRDLYSEEDAGDAADRD